MTQKEFSTKILGEAAFLHSLGFRFVRLDPSDKPRERVFVFKSQMPDGIIPFYKEPKTLLVAYSYHTLHEAVKILAEPERMADSLHKLKKMVMVSWETGE